ncbi:MAG TPA: short-chain dehydrogenase [Phycisphaerales bacterium]|nr:short-chain dehydrogenase [Phycisphaerales bacterium]
MAIDLTNKPIAITGAGSGIGRATALACAGAGMPVALSGRREEPLRAVAAEIERAGGRAVVVPGDVTSPTDCARLIERCVERFGSVYSVFANAGYGQEAPAHEMTDDDIRAMFETNFFGTLNTIRPAVPHMLRARAGHILVCSSCVAKFALPFFSVYSATKAAQNHLSRGMNLELRPHGVSVSSVHPVGTRTEFFDTAMRRSASGRLIKHTPDAFFQSPERVARAIVRCLRRPRPEVWTSLSVRLGMSLGMLLPGLSDRALRRMVDQRLREGEGAGPTAHAPPHPEGASA